MSLVASAAAHSILNSPQHICHAMLHAAALSHQSLFGQPVLDDRGSLVGVSVHHEHVRVSLNPELCQFDPVSHDTCYAKSLSISPQICPQRNPEDILVKIIYPYKR